MVKKHKKIATIIMSFIMATTVPTSVFAAPASYNEAEKDNLAKICEAIASKWDSTLSDSKDNALSDTETEIRITLDEAGQSMLGMASGMDLSWLNNLGFHVTASVDSEKQASSVSLNVNGNDICSFNISSDLTQAMQLLQVPEMSESWVKIVTGESVMDSQKLLKDPFSFIPDGNSLSEIVKHYGEIILKYSEDQETSNEALVVEDVEEQCTLLEARINGSDTATLIQEILTSAKEDKELETVLEKLSVFSGETDLNSSFQEYITSALNSMDMDSMQSDENGYISSKIWIGEDGKTAGREFAVCDNDGIPVLVLTYKAPENNDKSAVFFNAESVTTEALYATDEEDVSSDFVEEKNSFSFTGSGENTDGILKGNYSVSYNDITAAKAEVELQKDENGYPTGTIGISFPEDTEESNQLSSFSAKLSLDTNSFGVELFNAGVYLGNMNISSVPADEKVSFEIPEQIKEAEEYLTDCNLDKVCNNLKNADVPDEIIQTLQYTFNPVDTLDVAGIE